MFKRVLSIAAVIAIAAMVGAFFAAKNNFQYNPVYAVAQSECERIEAAHLAISDAQMAMIDRSISSLTSASEIAMAALEAVTAVTADTDVSAKLAVASATLDQIEPAADNAVATMQADADLMKADLSWYDYVFADTICS